jgi:signal transduction histidine kinase
MVALESSKPFRMLKPAELTALRQIAHERKISAGEDVFKEGDGGDGVYVVKEGLIEISVKMSENVRRVFSQVQPGELFGEMAVLEMKPRSASATAATETTVYFIPRDDMLLMVERSPALALELLREISQRLREFNRHYIREVIQTERLAIVGRFARSIVHDLKNPLNIISLTSEISAMDKADQVSRKNSHLTIRKQVERINDMVSEILEFTQGAPAVDLVLAAIDYGAYVQRLVEEIRPEAELRGCRLEVEALPTVKLPLDPKRLRRVFFNLIHNATDAMSSGGKIMLRFRVDKNELITEIEDTGPGIAPEIADRLFEAFATYGKAHGTGLGLSICKRIVEDHRGRVWAANRPGKGALFSFSLPIQ